MKGRVPAMRAPRGPRGPRGPRLLLGVLLLASVGVWGCCAREAVADPPRRSYADVTANRRPSASASLSPSASASKQLAAAATAAPNPSAADTPLRFPASVTADRPVTKAEDIAAASSQFSLDVTKSILRSSPGNVVVSPLGVSVLLSLLQQAADPLSNTAHELRQGLHLDKDASLQGLPRLLENAITKQGSRSTLETGCKLFANSDFKLKDTFVNIAKDHYDMDVTRVDFKKAEAAAQTINKWVSDATHSRIPAIVSQSSLSPRTSLVMASAMYFRGIWQRTFDLGKTASKYFSPDPSRNVTVSMMQQMGDFRGGETANAQWVELPFDGEHFSMLLVLPSKKHGLNEVLDTLQAKHLEEMVSAPTNPRRVLLVIPKFQINTDLSMSRTLKQLRMGSMFGRDAKLRGISDTPVVVSEVLHKAEMKVDEQGAMASAASAVLVNTLSLVSVSEDMRFYADNPFLAIIMDRTSKVPLFIGRVSDPVVEF